jgi:hypothetical protein
MNPTRTSAWRSTATVIRLALVGSAGLAGAQARSAADSAAGGTTKIVQGVHETAKGIGQTLTEGASTVEQRLKAAGAESTPTGEKLENGARGFGESIWGWHEVRRPFPAEALHGQLR